MIPSLTGIHFLVTYGCSAECDHCFIWGSPLRTASMTPSQVDEFLAEVSSLGTVTSVCAEGGEPFTRWEVLLHFVRSAQAQGLGPSALTNASWAISRPAAEAGVRELMAAGLTRLGVSTDQWHRRRVPGERADLLLEVCAALGLPASRMETTLGGVMFRGRAAERLAPGITTRPAEELTACPHEHLDAPSRVHLDCYGQLHLCQGLNVGPGGPAQAVREYDPAAHPIVRVLLEEGPYGLGRYAAGRGFALASGYVDACQLCYRAREFLRPAFPELLGPDEMYGGGFR